MKSVEFLESIENFEVSFGGKKSIDAELFTKTINDTIALTKASADAIEPTCFLRLDIQTNKEGSFVSVIDAIVRHQNDLLVITSISSNIIQGVLNFFLIKKHLNGKKAKKIESNENETAIQNQDNKIITVSKSIGQAYFKDNRIDNLVINITNNLSNSGRDNFSIKTKDNEITIEKSEYENMATSVIDENPVAKTIKQKPFSVELPLKKPDLLGDSKWEFIFNKAIQAKIEDKNFMSDVHKGKIKNLYAGVKIPCLLQVEYDLDDKSDLIAKSDRYTILQITGNIIEPDTEEESQVSLFDKK